MLVAGYIVFGLNQTFWAKAATNLDGRPVALALFAAGIFAIHAALLVALSVRYALKPILIAVIVTAGLAAWFMNSFGVIIDTDMIRNAAETNTAEARNLITPRFLLHVAVHVLLPTLLIVWVRVIHRPIWQKVKSNLAVIGPLLAVFVVVAFSNFSTYASTMREHRDMLKTLNPAIPIISAVKYVVRSGQERTIVAAPLGTDAVIGDELRSDSQPRVLLVVVGETARAMSFSLGGYVRKTNPELERQDIVYFPDTSSCGTATATSLPCMFSRETRATYTHAKGLSSENALDVLVHGGVRVEWWDNNTGDKEVAARLTKRYLPAENDTIYCEGGECKDEDLLARIDGWLDGATGDSVLVLHTLGSHGPAYYKRYPDAYRVFVPDCRTAEFADCSRDEIVNAYDNTILYTDHVLSEVINRLKARTGRIAGAMIYASDHGESLGEKGLYLHGAPYMFAPKEQTSVPFLMWMSSEFAATDSIDTECIRAKAGESYSHDNFFHTLLGMMDVHSEVLDRSLDIVASCKSEPRS